MVQSLICELLVQLVLERDGLIREVERVNIRRERNGRVARFADPIHRFWVAGRSDLPRRDRTHRHC
jgi:hypothetical protein